MDSTAPGSAAPPAQPAEPMQTDAAPEKRPDPPVASATTLTDSANAGNEETVPPAKKSKPGESADEPKGKETLTPERLQALSVRPYLEKTVVPVLMQGMHQLVKDRPDDPIDALADYLRANNPKRKQPEGTSAPVADSLTRP